MDPSTDFVAFSVKAGSVLGFCTNSPTNTDTMGRSHTPLSKQHNAEDMGRASLRNSVAANAYGRRAGTHTKKGAFPPA